MLTTCLLAACGSSTDSAADGAPAHGNDSLSGRFVSAEPFGEKAWMLDLATGLYATIPGTQWDDHPICDGAPGFTAYPSLSGDLLVEAVDTCNYGENRFELVHAVLVRDSEGTLLNSFGINTTVGGVRGPARLSPDGELIALPVDFGDTVYRLALFDRQGELIANGPRISGQAFDWLPDNRLIYADERDVYLTSPGTVDGEFLFGIGPDEGYPRQFAASPDGQNLAMVTIESSSGISNYGVPWVVNLDTLESRRLAHADDPLSSGDSARIEHPTWSPDGSAIALLYGQTQSAGWAELYVVSADAENVLLSEDNEQVTLVNSWYTQPLPFTAEPDYGPNWVLDGPFAWLPVGD